MRNRASEGKTTCMLPYTLLWQPATRIVMLVAGTFTASLPSFALFAYTLLITDTPFNALAPRLTLCDMERVTCPDAFGSVATTRNLTIREPSMHVHSAITYRRALNHLAWSTITTCNQESLYVGKYTTRSSLASKDYELME